MNRAREKAIRAGLALVDGSLSDSTRSRYASTCAPCRVLDQSSLDISVRSKVSRLPWRGQFAPELIKYLMETVCPDSRSFLDPFCGSGTVLFEAACRGYSSNGYEVNPAAWHLASLAIFARLPTEQKRAALNLVRSLRANAALFAALFKAGLFAPTSAAPAILDSISGLADDDFSRRLIAAIILLGMRDGTEVTPATISQGCHAVLQVLNEFTNSAATVDCRLSDARDIPIGSEAVDAIITSPPYINVFNYHQNYRAAVEYLGWRPLEAARSEIGANRKHRANRFFTVVQYCLDMSQCLDEMARALRPGALLVIVLGRTSNVLGTSFQNGGILSKLLALSNSFGSVQSAERVFTNRFGERIFEDILITRRERASQTVLDDAREIGLISLLSARHSVPEKNRRALDEAISRVNEVSPSPLLKLSIPAHFAAFV
jgi:hypothetical protein